MSKYNVAGAVADPTGRGVLLRPRPMLMASAALLALVAARPVFAQDASALPTGGVVVGGTATIGAPGGGTLQITQTSDRALINWDSFDIGSGAQVNFSQPGSRSVALNRVVGGDAPSQIAGQLNANGIVAVINGNGVLFAGTADVNVGGLIASTATIVDQNFMSGGPITFAASGASTSEIIVQAGASISIADQGIAAFFAPVVRNQGIINARLGHVMLASGSSATLDLDGTGFLEIGLGSDNALIENSGTINAGGGHVLMTAKAVSAVIDQVVNTGVISVASATADPDGTILLSAGTGNVRLGGGIDAGAAGRARVEAVNEINVADDVAATGHLALGARHILGAGSIGVTGGALSLALDVNGADTTGDGNFIADALGVIGMVAGGTTLDLGAGIYAAGATIGRNNVTIDGGGVATIRVPLTGGPINGLNVSGNGARVTGLTFAGTLPADQAAWDVDWNGSITRGIALANGVDNATIADNVITGVRNGLLVDGRGATSLAITGNLIDNTKSAISVQYVDAAAPGFNISGNEDGPFGNEWGVILHLNGIWDGSATTSGNGLLGAGPSLDEQARLLALSRANGGLSVYNQAYTASNRTHVTVDPAGTTNAQGAAPSPINTVQGGVDAVVTGGTVTVRPGDYIEGVTGVDYFGGAGGQMFGLYVTKDHITIRGVDAQGAAITDANAVAAYVTAAHQAGFGAQHFVSGTGVTIEGLGFKPYANGDNKAFEVIGDAFTMRHSVIDNRGNATEINFFISSFGEGDIVERFTLEDNIFYGGSAATHGSIPSAMVKIAGGVGLNSAASQRILSGNQFFGNDLAGQGGIQFQGRIPAIGWQQDPTGAATITGNSFSGVDVPVRSVGILSEALDWGHIFTDNIFGDGGVLAFRSDGRARGVEVIDGAESYETIAITTGIAETVAVAQAGDTVRMLNGTYDLGGSPLVIARSIALIGQSEAGVILDGRAVGTGPGSNGLGTISVFADNVTLGNFTLYGSEQLLGNYGIKVQPDPAGHVNTPGGSSQRLSNFAISDVTIRGSRRAELDLNGVVGATITNVTADGRSVADPAVLTGGAGIQITDSANVTLSGVHTLGNEWGGVALYQANKASGYSGQTGGITIDASDNRFEEAIGLYSQLESVTQGFGPLHLAGFDYVVRNSDHRSDGLDSQFAFYRTSFDDAAAFALGIGTAGASSIEGFADGFGTNIFSVIDGLSINTAIRDARAGGTINAGAGTFAETVTIDKGLTLNGAGMGATLLTGGIQLSGTFSDLTLSNFAVSGAAGSSVIGGGHVTNLTVDGVRIDGEGVAGRHGFSGGQYGGAISITNSQFLNIRGWAAFDTRSGAGTATDGTQISSAVFSDNLLDNTAGHIALRQQAGAGAYPTITIADNIVRNGGASDQSFGAIFKAFRASQVDFTGNRVSNVGTSSWTPAGEATYGAVLMMRDVGTLNVTGNQFTNNHQVFAVEPGYALPGTTRFIDNSFVNNGYAIYLPTTLSGAGTISFAGINDFVAGADTVQHIMWRSGSSLDLTGVSFNGTRAGDLALDELFTLEDLITHGVDVAGAGLARLVAGQLFVTSGSGPDSALRAVSLATAGDVLNLSAGTHLLTNTLLLEKGMTVSGQGQGVTLLDASGHNSYGIRVKGDAVTLSGFTLNGSSAALGNSNYGIKVEAVGDAFARNTGFSITDVTINGSRKTGLDLNAAVGALIDGVTVTGVTAGTGIAITDSANVTVRNSHTSGNAWGGLALYQANNVAGGGSNQQLTGVVIEASNRFGEAAGLYLQDSSTLLDPGLLTIAGYGFTVRNDAHRPDGAQFTYFQNSRQNAFDFAVNLGATGASVVQGWSGTGNSADFHVGRGTLAGGGRAALSIQTAFAASTDGDAIHVASGTYAENAMLRGIRTLNFGDVTLNGLTLAGAGSRLIGQLTLATGDFTADRLLLNGDTSIHALAGDISIAGVTGTAALTLAGGRVSLGQSSLAGLGVTGTTIVTADVTTSGSQRYTGATSLSGSYDARDFTVDGATSLTGSTNLVASGTARFGMVDGTVAGRQGFTVHAGTAELGALGSRVRLDAVNMVANRTILNGARYAANSLRLSGDAADATVRVTRSVTQFDTRPARGAVTIGAQLIGTSHGGQNVEIVTGSGLAGATGEGAILLGNVGSDALRLGSLTITGGDFSAATVKLAGDFASQLSGDQRFTANTLDTLGNVSASVAGSESGPIRAGGSVAVTANDSGTGSIIAGGPVLLAYMSDVARNVSSQSGVTVTAGGAVGGSIAAGGTATIASQTGISSNVTAGGGVSLTASSGDVSGSINAGGPVNVRADLGSISSQVVTTGDASLTAGAGGISSSITAGGGVAVAAPGAVTSRISAGGAVALTSDTPLDVQVNGGAVTVKAPGGTVTGAFGKITTNESGSFIVNDQPVVGNGDISPSQIIIDRFVLPAGGTIGAGGEISLPAHLALALLAPDGGAGGAQPPVVVNGVGGLGDLLRRGYTAIVIQLDDPGLEMARELTASDLD
ncbi:MAG TPA: right-handed parallel beta-helix repeat-containing protein [Sphingobium sp.]|nr:right-handed parallel beta-helix repeat-containing protein [Sphingobium sp.]